MEKAFNSSCHEASRCAGGRPWAFSLVEIIAVVMILGILTLIALPLVGDINTSTGEAALRGNVASLRSAIELYANQHNGLYPAAAGDGSNAAGTEAAFIAQLAQYSNAAGVVSATKSASHPYGPYLKLGIPSVTTGPLTGNNQINVTAGGAALTPDGSPTKGWKYSHVTGQIICNSGATSSDGVTALAQF